MKRNRMDVQTKNGLALTGTIVFVLAFLFICVFTDSCKADSYSDTMISYFAKRIDRLEEKIDQLEDTTAEMRGRQSVTTGLAAGVTPTSLLAAFLIWWFRRERRK